MITLKTEHQFFLYINLKKENEKDFPALIIVNRH